MQQKCCTTGSYLRRAGEVEAVRDAGGKVILVCAHLLIA